MKRIVSSIIVMFIILSYGGVIQASTMKISQESFWNYEGEVVQIDEFITDEYAMRSFYDGEIVYVITVLRNGEIEFAWATIGGSVYSHTFYDRTIAENFYKIADFFENDDAIKELKTYSLNHLSENALIYEEVEPYNPIENEINGMVQSDYNALMSQIKNIHGSEHVGKNWTGMVSNKYQGLTYAYKEDLDYGLNYRDSAAYSAGMTLGAVVARLLSKIPQVSVPMRVIAEVLEVASAVNTVIDSSGQIASYYGYAVYDRYVLIEGGGPYLQCFRNVDYDGWINVGDSDSAVLVETADEYNPDQSIFEDYVQQRQIATSNYNN